MKKYYDRETLDNLLFDAAANGKCEMLALLLERGADIHAKNDFALRLAAGHGQREAVAFLISQGADVHAANDDALRMAAANGYEEIALIITRQMVKRTPPSRPEFRPAP